VLTGHGLKDTSHADDAVADAATIEPDADSLRRALENA
jgi:hypothetical protein